MLRVLSSTMITIVISTLSVGVPQVYASSSSPYDSGYDHGCDDAGRSESDKYINQPEKGSSTQTSLWTDIMQD